MNLQPRHLLVLLAGIAAGAGAGWLIWPLIAAGALPEVERAVGVRGSGALLGGVAGAALSVLSLLVRAVRDPGAEPSRNFSTVNGTGSTLIGRRDVAADGSYATTEWFVIVGIPIFPICRYRVTERGRGAYDILEKGPPRAGEAIRVYALAAVVGGCVAAVFRLRSARVALLAIAAGIAVCVWQRRRGRGAGIIYTKNFCRQCGYRLTGNTSGRCPECGTPTAARGGEVRKEGA